MAFVAGERAPCAMVILGRATSSRYARAAVCFTERSSAGSALRRSSLVAFAITLGVLLPWCAPFVEDWDGAGFALAAEGVDLARFRPHPPGYPAYVLVARALGALGVSPSHVAPWLSRWSAVGLSLWACALAERSRARTDLGRVAVGVLSALSIAGLVRLGTSVAPTALAVGAWGMALVELERAEQRAPWRASVWLGLALAARPTDVVPIFAATLALARRTKTASLSWVGASILATIAHAPIVLSTGVRAFARRAITHGYEHFERSADRLIVASRLDTLSAFFSEHDGAAGALFAGAVLTLAALALLRGRDGRRRTALALGVALCFAWWIAAQPPQVERHLAWIGALAARGLAEAMTATSKPLAGFAMAAALAGVGCSITTAVERRATPPASVQLARALRGRGEPLFGARAARAAEVEGVTVFVAEHEGEVWSTLERLRRLPRAAWVTDEVQPWRQDASIEVVRYCGPRSARREPRCVRARRLRLRDQ